MSDELSSWTTAANRVMRPAIYRRLALVLWRVNFGRTGRRVTRRVTKSERDCVNATVAVVLTLGAQLDGLAAGGDDDVVQRGAITSPVLNLIARRTNDVDVADA